MLEGKRDLPQLGANPYNAINCTQSLWFQQDSTEELYDTNIQIASCVPALSMK